MPPFNPDAAQQSRIGQTSNVLIVPHTNPKTERDHQENMLALERGVNRLPVPEPNTDTIYNPGAAWGFQQVYSASISPSGVDIRGISGGYTWSPTGDPDPALDSGEVLWVADIRVDATPVANEIHAVNVQGVPNYPGQWRTSALYVGGGTLTGGTSVTAGFPPMVCVNPTPPVIFITADNSFDGAASADLFLELDGFAATPPS